MGFFRTSLWNKTQEVFFMQPLYLHWHNKAELKRVLQVLQERGYRNVHDLATDYSFPVVAVDHERKIFYESHASYMAAHLISGTLKLYDWEEADALIS